MSDNGTSSNSSTSLLKRVSDYFNGNGDTPKIETLDIRNAPRENVSRPSPTQPVAFHTGGSYPLGYGDSRSGGAQWPYGVANRGRWRTLKHHRMLMNGRDAYHDSVQARAIVSRLADNVAGTGLRVEPLPVASILGITDMAAEEGGYFC